MSFFKSIFIVVSLLLLTSCSFFEKEDPLEREREELNDVLDGFFVTYWRGAKISLRSLPINGDEATIDFESIQKQQNQNMSLGPKLSSMFNYVNRSVLEDRKDLERPTLSSADYIVLAKEIYDLRRALSEVDEDQYPTLIEIASNTQKVLNKEPLVIPEGWNPAFEHWVFAMIMETKASPGSWKTYELNKMDITSLPKTDYQILASFQNTINYIANGWFYLAEESSTNTLAFLKNDINLSDELAPMHIPVAGMKNEEIFRIQMRGVTKLIRGFSRYKTEDKTLDAAALQDVGDAFDDFQQIGLNNEITWLAAIFLHTKKGEVDKAILNIEKLEKSRFVGRHEKALLGEAKGHLKNRDPDAALATITDKIIMFGIGFTYARSYLLEIEWTNFLEKSAFGRRMLKVFPELKRSYNKAKKYLDLDNLSAGGKQLLDQIH